ncbi:MAG: hypothetical protein ACK5DD_14890 [Cyclobacteriaceae bacterium]|jgi:hypothetical protein
MAKNPRFRPIIGAHWTETTSDDELILNELKRLGISRYLRPSKKDLTMLGANKRLVLIHMTGQAIMVWEKQPFIMKNPGLRCVLFVNNSQIPSIVLLKEAMKMARLSWMESPFFVDLLSGDAFPKEIESVLRICGWEAVEGLHYYHSQIYASYFESSMKITFYER